MSSTITYLPVFNLNILHNYFLDRGDKDDPVIVFDDKQKPDRLSAYNVSDFLRITPSQDSKRILTNHKVVFKTTTLGASCFISVDQDKKPSIDVTDVTLDFLIYSKDVFFEKYTNLDTANQGIYFFTNDALETENQMNVLANDATDLESYKVEASSELTSKYQTLLSKLTGRERRSLFGIVSIKLDALLEAGAVEDPIEFKVVLKNRKTLWVYLDQDDTIVVRTKTVQPFVQKGNITPVDESDVIIPHRMATPSDAFAYQTDTELPIQTKIYI